MSQHYSDPRRARDAHALPNVETFYHDAKNPFGEFGVATEEGIMPTGWYFWYCFPGCMPDGEPDGPYDTEQAAIDAMRADADIDDDDTEGED